MRGVTSPVRARSSPSKATARAGRAPSLESQGFGGEGGGPADEDTWGEESPLDGDAVAGKLLGETRRLAAGEYVRPSSASRKTYFCVCVRFTVFVRNMTECDCHFFCTQPPVGRRSEFHSVAPA